MKLAKSKGIDVSFVSIHGYEHGTVPHFDMMLALTHIYEVSMAELLLTDIAHEAGKAEKAAAKKLVREAALAAKLNR